MALLCASGQEWQWDTLFPLHAPTEWGAQDTGSADIGSKWLLVICRVKAIMLLGPGRGDYAPWAWPQRLISFRGLELAEEKSVYFEVVDILKIISKC